MLVNNDLWEQALATTLGPTLEKVQTIVRELQNSGARLYAVGGWVRDVLRQQPAKDLDIEIFGLEAEQVLSILEKFGPVETVGVSFGVLRLKGLNVDFSLPRREQKQGPGHKGFQIISTPHISLSEAAKRRDLTINALALNLPSLNLEDPYHGLQDLEQGILRPVCEHTFIEDPLRVYRVAQFLARFDYMACPELKFLCSNMQPEGLSSERIYAEIEKLLVLGRKPSLGFVFLQQCGWLQYFPEIAALTLCPQDPKFHSEGNVWIHTLLVLDAAVEWRSGNLQHDRLLMFAALCHDLGKPVTTLEHEGSLRSFGHDQEGARLTREFLARITHDLDLIEGVAVLVKEHMVPWALFKDQAGPAAIRRLAQRLQPYADITLLADLTRADEAGRLPVSNDFYSAAMPSEQPRHFSAADWLIEQAKFLDVQHQAESPILLGRHLIAAGFIPGPSFGPMLKKAYDLQIEHGIKNPDVLLKMLLDKSL